MNTNFIKQFILLVFTLVLLYYSSGCLTSMPDLENFYEKIMVMTFFLFIIPFFNSCNNCLEKIF